MLHPLKWLVESLQLRSFCTSVMWGGSEVLRRSLSTCAQLLSVSQFQIPVENTFEKVPTILIYNPILNQASDLYHLPRVQQSAEKFGEFRPWLPWQFLFLCQSGYLCLFVTHLSENLSSVGVLVQMTQCEQVAVTQDLLGQSSTF